MQPIKLSVSKSKTYSDCGKKYNFAYNLKMPRKDKDYHIFGKFVHKVLEDFHRELIAGSIIPFNKIMANVYKAAILEYGALMTDVAKKEAYDIIDAYLQKLAKEEDQNVLSVEKNFSFHISDYVILNGMIDRIQKDPDGILHVCDYKTTKNKKYLKNDFFQLLTYAYVICSEDPTIEVVRGSYILLRHDFEYITKDFLKKDILKIKDKYEDYAKSISDEKLWRANPTPLCAYCEYLDLCPEGKAFASKNARNVINGEVAW